MTTRLFAALRRIALPGVLVLLAACAAEAPQATAPQPAAWRVVDAKVTVPDRLTVSTDPDERVPATDINWWQEAGTSPAERRIQVGAILLEAARQGLAGLKGATPVTAEVEVIRFHALTPRARARCALGFLCLGANDIDYRLTLRAQGTGSVVASEVLHSSPKTLQGSAAIAADRAGSTDRARIIEGVAADIRAWAG